MWNLVRGWFPFAYQGGASSVAVSRFCIHKIKKISPFHTHKIKNF